MDTLMGKRIKALRTEREITQRVLAEYLGLTPKMISFYEQSQRVPPSDIIIKLSHYFDVSTDYLLGETDIKSRSFASEEISGAMGTKKTPLLGNIAAGLPSYTGEETRTLIDVDADLDIDFCLQVRGDSMIDAHIKDGDIVFVRSQPDVENGEIAVVLIDDEATLKRVYKMDNGVLLKAENPAFQPMIFNKEDYKEVTILGKAVMIQGKVL